MCGIAFIYDIQSDRSDTKVRMSSAIRAMHARGPDASAQFQCESATIGHARLSVVDLAGSQQPMHSEDNRYHLTFNGEIYNYKLLRERLLEHWDFKTDGDTEVLLAGLVLEGEHFVSRMEGMWAFALWDAELKELWVCRDRTGKKPLFYTLDAGRFACASELPALNQLWGERWQENLDSTADYFRYGYPLPGHTFYQNVHELLPATLGKWSVDSGMVTHKYWEPVIRAFSGNYRQARLMLHDALENSVSQRLVSDVEVGSFLSGGMDSSVITALASQQLGAGKLKTFTVGFHEKSFDERLYAKQVALHLGVDHKESVIDHWNLALIKTVLFERLGQPFQDPSLLPTSEVARFASEHVKVALSGDGSDELFCGYQRYKARAIQRLYGRAPKTLRKFIRSAVAKFPEPDTHHSRSIIKKLHLFMDIVDKGAVKSPYVAPQHFSGEQFEELFVDLKNRGHQHCQLLGDEIANDDIKQLMLADTFVYLPQDIHAKVDRASMAASLEVRSPFMGTSVVELALSLPIQWVFSYHQNKKILAHTFNDMLPKNVWRRRKQGFSAPISTWFRSDVGSEFVELLNATTKNLPFKKDAALWMLAAHQKQRGKDYGHLLWSLYVYLLWRKESALLEVE